MTRGRPSCFRRSRRVQKHKRTQDLRTGMSRIRPVYACFANGKLASSVMSTPIQTGQDDPSGNLEEPVLCQNLIHWQRYKSASERRHFRDIALVRTTSGCS